MGLRTAAMACQRATNAVRYILSTAGCHVFNYLDDLIGVALSSRALRDYEFCDTSQCIGPSRISIQGLPSLYNIELSGCWDQHSGYDFVDNFSKA